MSHLRPEDKKHKKSDCRKGRHVYGVSQHIGAGILRRVCQSCARVTIDLTKADELKEPATPGQSSTLSLAAQQLEA